MESSILLSLVVSDPQRLAPPFLALGVAFHLCIRNYEIDYQILRLLVVYFAVWAGLVCVNVTHHGLGLLAATGLASLAGLSFITGLSISMGVYRFFFHRLHHFPGPLFARVSKLYAFSLQAKNLQFFLEQQKLREKYGDFVRTGPRELTIFRSSAIPIIYGPQSPCRKSTWYHQVSGIDTENSLNTTRDVTSHRMRRRAWDRGLNRQTIDNYEYKVNAKGTVLLTQLKTRLNKPLDITQWARFYSYDVMGLVGLGEDFDQLQSSTIHYAVKGVTDQMSAAGFLRDIPWLTYNLNVFQSLTAFGAFKKYCTNVVHKSEERYRKSPEKIPRELISWLLKAKYENDPTAPPTDAAMAEDGNLIIVAGSDTTTSTLASMIYYLIANPHVYKELQKLLDEIFPNGNDSFDYMKIRDLDYLTAIIKETLRLKPVTPSGQFRLAPPQGIHVDGVWIPGDTIVLVPQWTIHRDETLFPRPDEFVPERWLEGNEALLPHREAWFPWQIGPYGCVGKQLAMMSMRSFLTRIALSFDVAFAPGEDGVTFDTDVKDYVALHVGSLDVVFSEREK